MTPWQWGLIALGATLVAYAGIVVLLAAFGRTADARALARFVPDCVVLFRRLLSDPRISRGRKLLLLGLVAYLSMPLDLIPDFIPFAGQLDDAIIVALVLRHLVRTGGEPLLRELWPGPERSLTLILRLARIERRTP
jgi:uncharacterized membrane protein YkvA (DUF1232 family)